MIKEAYVSFEVAKLLKEKGFDVPTHVFYNPKKDYILKFDPCLIDRNAGIYVSAPTHQMVLAWLREVHNIHIDICSNWDVIHWIYQVFVITPRTAHNSYVDKILYTSYEQAVEAGIKYALENLI